MKRLIGIVFMATALMLVVANTRLTPGEVNIVVCFGAGIIGTFLVGGRDNG